MMRHIQITGHRGAAALCPENALSGIRKAMEIGVDRIEIDVHQTKDGKIIVMHDNSIDRTTNSKGIIKQLDYFALQNVRLLNTTNDTAYDNEKIPTLEEVLQLINGSCRLLIEIKEGSDYYANIEQHILEIIDQYKAEEWCIIHSFKDKVLKKIHTLKPTIELHKLLVVDFFTDLRQYDYIPEFSISSAGVTPAFVNKLHQANKKVNVWTVNDLEKMRKLVAMGVDGIITDHPDKGMMLRTSYS